MNVTGECTVSGSREALFDKLADPFFFASCFDGVSGLTETGPGRYDAAFETTVAYMKFRFKMQVEIVRLARPETIETKIEGTPAGIGGRLAATTRLEHARLHHQYQRRRTAPVVTVERAYYRDDPIIVGRPPAKPPNDYSYSKAVMRSALLFDALVAAGVPDVKPSGRTRSAARMFTVVAITQRYAGHARQAGHILNQCGAGAYMSRYSVVVDDDMDHRTCRK